MTATLDTHDALPHAPIADAPDTMSLQLFVLLLSFWCSKQAIRSNCTWEGQSSTKVSRHGLMPCNMGSCRATWAHAVQQAARPASTWGRHTKA